MSNLRWSLLIIGGVILLGIYLYGRWRSQSRESEVFGNVLREEPDILLGKKGKSAVETDPALKRQLSSIGKVGKEELLGTLDRDAGKVDAKATKSSAPAQPESLADKPAVSTVKLEKTAAAETTRPSAVTGGESVGASDAVPGGEARDVADEKATAAGEPDDGVVVIHIVAPKGKPFTGRAVLKAFHANAMRYGDMDIFHRIKTIDGEQHKIFSLASMVKPGTLNPQEIVNGEIRGLSLFTTLPNKAGNIVAFDEMLHCAQHMATTLGGELRDQTLRPMTHGSIMLQRSNLRKRFPEK